MGNRINGHFLVIGCLAALAFLSACAPGGMNLVEDGRLRIDVEAPDEITISVKGVYLKEGLVEIKGAVWWQRGSPDELYSAHVDLEVACAEDTAIREYGVTLRRIFVFRGGSRQRARFSALVEPCFTEDSTLRVIFHQGVHDEPNGASDPSAPLPDGGT